MPHEDEVHVPALYMLTAITGRRRNEGREIVSKSGIVIDRRFFHLALMGTMCQRRTGTDPVSSDWK
ncbi:hypothetical protein FH969_14010 [Miniimonas arenae]|uniref:Uncharacterized protein n=1 Tax=Miniimonas arenae TaxID=676201 RepID=A0A5C5B7J4_9MICO|nr:MULTISPECIES: hypothetical protein [Miniimonas]TNU72943.1 hypothetical protein FH969_14010 [Miniimonas arenae]